MKRIDLFKLIVIFLAIMAPTRLTQARGVQLQELNGKGAESQELHDYDEFSEWRLSHASV
jgi:hypothetical protein